MYQLKTHHGTTIIISNNTAMHSYNITNPLYFFPISSIDGILISQNNLDAYFNNNKMTYIPFCLLNVNSPALLHLIKYYKQPEGKINIKDIYTDKYLCAVPLNNDQKEIHIQPREKIGIWENFMLDHQEPEYNINDFISIINHTLTYGINKKIQEKYEILLLDLLLNYKTLVYLGTYSLNYFDWYEQFLNIYSKSPRSLIFSEYKKISEFRGYMHADMNFTDLFPVSYSIPYGDRMPIILNMLKRSQHKPKKKSCVLTVARNEGIYLLEYVAYYKAIGVDHIFIYSNNNSDKSEIMLETLSETGYITYIDNQPSSGRPQYNAYAHAFNINKDILDYEWTIVVDLDEFVVLNNHKYKNINNFLKMHEYLGSDIISLNWKVMYPNSQLSYSSGLLLERFPIGAPHPLVKSIVKTIKAFQSHAHYALIPEQYINIRRHADGTFFKQNNNGRAFTNHWNEDDAVCYHFLFKSFDEYLVKKSRNTGDKYITEGIDFSQMDISCIRQFIDNFSYSCSKLHSNSVKYFIDLTKDKISRMLKNKNIQIAYEEVQHEYSSMILQYRKEFIKYIDQQPEIKDMVLKFLKRVSASNGMFTVS